MVTGVRTDSVGVPERAPVVESKERPAGRAPERMEKVQASPLIVGSWLVATPFLRVSEGMG